MKNWSEKVVQVAIDDLREHPENPRKGDVPRIVRSITANGYYGVLRVQKSTGFVLTGNNTLRALRRIGHSGKVAVVYLDIDDDEALRVLSDDNGTSDVATYDEERRVALLRKLDESDMLTGAVTRDEVHAIFKALAPAEGTSLGKTPNGYIDGPGDAEVEDGGSAPPRTRIITLVFERKAGDRIERRMEKLVREKGVTTYEEALALLLGEDDGETEVEEDGGED